MVLTYLQCGVRGTLYLLAVRRPRKRVVINFTPVEVSNSTLENPQVLFINRYPDKLMGGPLEP